MIPYWHATTIWLGSVPIQVWGLFVALGFAVAIWLAVRQAPRTGINPKHVVDFAVWAIVAAMVGARLLYVVENLALFAGRPWWSALAIWEGGSSSYGGFIGAIVVAVWFLRKRRIPRARFADLVMLHFPFGWFIGRLGCYSIHDHAGVPCSGFFCVPFPDGTRRLDMGLLDGLGTFAIYPALLWLARKPQPPGLLIGVLAAWYGLQRFLFDFFRATSDVLAGTPKYGGMTLAQVFSVALVIVGAVLLVKSRFARTPL